MTANIEVSVSGLAANPSVEAAIHRWVARLEAMQIDIRSARVSVEPTGRRQQTVRATFELADRTERTVTTVHADVYVAVGDAFRALRRQALPAPPPRIARGTTGAVSKPAGFWSMVAFVVRPS